jgi:peptide/nickel transport system permease protein
MSQGGLVGAGRAVGRTLAVALTSILLVILAMETLGDPVAARLPPEAPPDQVAHLRQQLGLDRPFSERLASRLSGALVGDFGTSYAIGEPAGALVLRRLPASFALIGAGGLLGASGGLALGALLFCLRRRFIGAPLRTVVLGLQAVPVFVLAIVAVRVVAAELRLLPPSGSGDLPTLILPALVVGFDLALGLAIFLEAVLSEAQSAPFAVVAVGKGLRARDVDLQHLLPAALPSFGSYVGLRLARLAGGALVVEEVFAYDGLGRLALFGLRNRDLPLVLACTVTVVLVVGGLRLLSDLVAPALDPRLRSTP